MSRTGRIAAGLLATAAGIALLVWQVHLVHVDRIVEGFRLVGWGFGWILLLSGLRYVVRAIAWTTLLGGGVPIGAALGATIAGDAVGNLTPLRLLASEPMKAVLLREHVDTPRALAALVAENVFYSASVAIVVVLGTAAMLAAFDVPPTVRVAGWMALGGMTTALAIVLWIVWQRPTIVSASLARVRHPRIAATVERVRRFEQDTYAFVGGHPARLATVVLCELVFHALSFGESYVTLQLLTGHASPLAAFVLDTVNRVINVVFMIVPLRMGVAETGQSMVTSAIGIGAGTGVTFALIGKARVIAWAAVGIVGWGGKNLLGKRAKETGQR